MQLLDHVSISVSNLDQARRFCDSDGNRPEAVCHQVE